MAPGDERTSLPAYAERLAWLEAQEVESPTEQRGRRLLVRGWAALWPKVLAVAIVLGVWQLIHLSGWKKEIFPGPGGTLADLWDQLHTGLLWHAIGTTAERAVIGFGLAVVIGAVIGALVSRIAPLRSAVGSLITGLQTLPSIAWFPFAIILFGINTTAILFVILLGAAPSIANGLINGVDNISPVLLRAGNVLGAKRWDAFRYVILPAALPSFVGGLKQGWAFAWRSLLAGEIIGGIVGYSLGQQLAINRDNADAAGVQAVMIVLFTIGVLIDVLVFSNAERRIRKRYGLVDVAAA